MSHAQAFHTSCRSGLGGGAGFQINAATPSLDREQLAAMSDAHARYEAPRDLPHEPTAAEIREFPVALKMSRVPAVGPVVSRTEYVGREYRGVDGAPDEGRFGNYFCHMVVGAPGDDPFDGLYAVELWDAPHWTTTEASAPELPALGALAPGSIDIATVLDLVARAETGVAAALLDGARAALDGGPPLLIVDPVPGRVPTWIAWITYTLPAELAAGLTFSTFEGRPQDVRDLHVVATTPACDVGPQAGAFARVGVTAPIEAGRPSLYTRAAIALADAGPEALAGAVRRVDGRGPDEHGASLAIHGRVTHVADGDDIEAVLDRLLRMVPGSELDVAAAAVADLPPSESGDRRAISRWAELYVRARESRGEPARDLASVALERLATHIDGLPDDLRPVPADAPTVPHVSGIGKWLRAVEAARGSDESGRLVEIGADLGLVGLNVPVDHRLAAVVAGEVGRPAMSGAVGRMRASSAADGVLARAAELIAEEADRDPSGRLRLTALAGSPAARRAVRDRAQELQTFEARAAWQHMRVAAEPAARRDAARELAGHSSGERDEAVVRALWGERGPRTAAELNDLLCAYVDADRPIPAEDRDRAMAVLMDSPLPTRRPAEGHIGYTLARLPRPERRRAELYAWVAGLERPSEPHALSAWAVRTAAALRADLRQVPEERRRELVAIAAETLVGQRGSTAFADSLAQFRDAGFDRLCEALGDALAARVERASEPAGLAAREFDFWVRLPFRGIEDAVLPIALASLSRGEREEVAELLTPSVRERWDEWAERHPRGRARAAVVRALGRGKRGAP